MSMTAVNYGNTARHKVPNCNPPIIATHCQIVASTVEGARECFASRVKVAIVVLKLSQVIKPPLFVQPYLWIILTK